MQVQTGALLDFHRSYHEFYAPPTATMLRRGHQWVCEAGDCSCVSCSRPDRGTVAIGGGPMVDMAYGHSRSASNPRWSALARA